jgi:hypothetical protein
MPELPSNTPHLCKVITASVRSQHLS